MSSVSDVKPNRPVEAKVEKKQPPKEIQLKIEAEAAEKEQPEGKAEKVNVKA